jgi:hypothetical protein
VKHDFLDNSMGSLGDERMNMYSMLEEGDAVVGEVASRRETKRG